MLRLSQACASIPTTPTTLTQHPLTPCYISPLTKERRLASPGVPDSHLIHLTVCVHSRREKRHCQGGGRCENYCRQQQQEAAVASRNSSIFCYPGGGGDAPYTVCNTTMPSGVDMEAFTNCVRNSEMMPGNYFRKKYCFLCPNSCYLKFSNTLISCINTLKGLISKYLCKPQSRIIFIN